MEERKIPDVDSDYPAKPFSKICAKEMRGEEKTPEIETKSGNVVFGFGDYRGVISIILVVAFVVAIFLNQTAALILGPFVGSVVTRYFMQAESRNGSHD